MYPAAPAAGLSCAGKCAMAHSAAAQAVPWHKFRHCLGSPCRRMKPGLTPQYPITIAPRRPSVHGSLSWWHIS